MALEGKLADLYDTLKWLDEQGITYQEAVDAAHERLDRLLALEGVCAATTTKSPTGRKIRSDRGKKRRQEPRDVVELAAQTMMEG